MSTHAARARQGRFEEGRSLPVALLAAALSFAPAAQAQAATAGDAGDAVGGRIVTLDTMVVTGVAPVLATTFVTDTKLPRQPVPASDGADYLKTIPGFGTLRSGGTNGDPVLRGMFGSRLNLLTNDGHMQGGCPSRMDNAMSYVAPETYDRLTVVKGPQTVLWGPGGSAGTVRFERDAPYFAEPGVEIAASALGGSFDRNDQVLDASAGTPRGYVRVAGNRSEADDYRDGSGARVPSAWRKWNVDAAVGWTPDADTLLEAGIGRGDGQARYAGRGMDGSRFDRDSAQLRFQRSFHDGVLEKVEANLYRNSVDHVMDNYSLRDPDPTGMPMPMASNVANRSTGGRVALAWRQEHWDATAGIDAREDQHRRRSAMGRGAYLAQPWTHDARSANVGAFAEAGWQQAPGQRWVAGLRVDRARVEDLRSVTAGMMPRPNPTAGDIRHDTLASGFLRVEGRAAGSPLEWYAGVGRAERIPDYWELFSPGSGPSGSANAFAGVQPERTLQLDVGLQYHGADWDVWASAYAGRIDDYILFDYLSGGMGSSTRAGNADARIAGGEAGVDWRPRTHWKLGGTLAYAWGELDAGGALPQMPPLEAKFSAGYDNRRWSAGALLRVVAAQRRVNQGHGNVVGQDLGPSAGFAVFSLNGGYRFSERVQLVAGIDNLFDRDYAEHLNLAGNSAFGYPADPMRIHEPGRSVWVKLDYRY